MVIAAPIADRLRDDILQGDFPPGERLIELQLTERYGVGRAAIRAARVELDAAGLVQREANRGATVRRHIANLYAKIGARGRADAATYALRHGLAP